MTANTNTPGKGTDFSITQCVVIIAITRINEKGRYVIVNSDQYKSASKRAGPLNYPILHVILNNSQHKYTKKRECPLTTYNSVCRIIINRQNGRPLS